MPLNKTLIKEVNSKTKHVYIPHNNWSHPHVTYAKKKTFPRNSTCLGNLANRPLPINRYIDSRLVTPHTPLPMNQRKMTYKIRIKRSTTFRTEGGASDQNILAKQHVWCNKKFIFHHFPVSGHSGTSRRESPNRIILKIDVRTIVRKLYDIFIFTEPQMSICT